MTYPLRRHLLTGRSADPDPLTLGTAIILTPNRRPSELYQAIDGFRPLYSVKDNAFTTPYVDGNGAITQSGATQNIIAHGDSITQGTGTNTFPYLAALVRSLYGDGLICNYKGRGISGQGFNYVYATGAPEFANLTTDALTYIDPLRNAGLTNRLIVFAGTNDITLNATTGANCYTLLTTYLNARISSGGFLASELVVVPMLPREAGAKEADRTAYNNAIAGDAGGIGYKKVPTTDTLLFAAYAQNNTTYFQGDKIHLTNAGAARLAAAIKAVL